MVRAVGPGDVADDIGDGAEPVHIGRRRVGDVRAALHQNTDLALIAQSLLGGSNRARAADCNRHHVPRKQDDVANRNNDHASGGSCGAGEVVLAVPSCAVPARPISATVSTRFLECNQEAAITGGAADIVVSPGRQPHAALETALGKFKAMNNRGLQFRGKHANSRDD